jgi:hypothetical protein
MIELKEETFDLHERKMLKDPDHGNSKIAPILTPFSLHT